MSELQVIDQREVLGKDFKIYGDFENPLFLARDVAEWIDYDLSSVNKLVGSVDEVEKVRKIVPTLGGNQEAWLLTEDGLYEVLMQSRKPIAKQFKIKVKEILKSIRKKGIYATGITIDKMIADPDFAIQLLTSLKEEKEKRLFAERQVENLFIQLDESKHWYTVKRVAQLNRVDWKTLDWRLLKAKSQQLGLKVDKIFDANFGTVNSYHEDVWKIVYPRLVY